MKQQHHIADKPFTVVPDIDHVLLHPDQASGNDQMLDATRKSINVVLQDFLAIKNISKDRIALVDAFLFLFNEPEFANWHTLSWWEQRRRILAIRDHKIYTARAQELLSQSSLAPYVDYADDEVAKSTELQVKHAWMRKRLVLKECFWNAIDTVSHAAYFQKKYQDQFPALYVLLCNVTDSNGRETEMFLGIDNGSGFVYKKKSRESSLFRLIYKAYKFLFRGGVFYIGGLELGLLETDGELSCHGSGAVVYQRW